MRKKMSELWLVYLLLFAALGGALWMFVDWRARKVTVRLIRQQREFERLERNAHSTNGSKE